MSKGWVLDAAPGKPASLRTDRPILLLLLGVTFARGLVYWVLMPPWQHYDEPTHFEYVRLIAERHHIPRNGEYDLAMRREIASSMEAIDFWKDWGSPPFGFWTGEPPYIGVSELAHPPLYYVALALPQIIVASQSVEVQLYTARLCSLLLYVIVVAAGYAAVKEGFPQRRWLPLAVAACIAFLPSLTDLMSGVSNDVGAAAASSVFLWSAVRLVRRGPTLERIGLASILAVVCVLTKATAGAVALAILAAVGLVYIPWVRRRWALVGLALSIPTALMLTLSWDQQAAYWYSDSSPGAPNQVRAEMPLGRRALALAADGHTHPQAVFQELSKDAARDLQGTTVTLGAWMKATGGEERLVTLSLYDGQEDHRHTASATSDWEFHAFTATLGVATPGVAIRAELPPRADGAGEVYIDGVVLVEGQMPIEEPHSFATSEGSGGLWGGQPFENLLRNGSAEKTWPGLRAWARGAELYQTPVLWILQSLIDAGRTGWVYGREIQGLLRSFWATFGWNHLSLPAAWVWSATVVSMVAMVGAAAGFIRRCRGLGSLQPWQWRVWVVFGVATVVGWGTAILRIHPVFETWRVFWPSARYAVVTIVPTATLLLVGLAGLVPRRWLPAAAWLGLLGLLTMQAVAIWKVIIPYYYG